MLYSSISSWLLKSDVWCVEQDPTRHCTQVLIHWRCPRMPHRRPLQPSTVL